MLDAIRAAQNEKRELMSGIVPGSPSWIRRRGLLEFLEVRVVFVEDHFEHAQDCFLG
jgi:hypothetical protein